MWFSGLGPERIGAFVEVAFVDFVDPRFGDSVLFGCLPAGKLLLRDGEDDDVIFAHHPSS